MKKSLILGLVSALMFGIFSIVPVLAEEPTEEQSIVIRDAIDKYKNKNYLGCISDLQLLTDKDPSVAIAWYYIGSSYMKISMVPEAHYAFDKVIQLNSVPQLTSYSIQAKLCMENTTQCKYEDFTYAEIQQLRADPVSFLNEYFVKKSGVNKDQNNVEIEKLIDGTYRYYHPNAKNFIDQERIKMQQAEINRGKAALPTDLKMARIMDIVKNNNTDISTMAMMLENNQINQMDYSEYYKHGETTKVTPEMVQMMMMNNSIQNLYE